MSFRGKCTLQNLGIQRSWHSLYLQYKHNIIFNCSVGNFPLSVLLYDLIDIVSLVRSWGEKMNNDGLIRAKVDFCLIIMYS